MKSFNLKRILGIVSGLTALALCGHPSAQTITIAPTGAVCVGDTIKVTATAANIDDLVLPKGTHWSGDADNAVVATGTNSITKRFYTYHPYLESNPTANSTKNFDFTIRLKDGSTKTVTQAIVAKSCPPTMNAPSNPPKEISLGEKYNLGIIFFEFTCTNPTSNPARMRFEPGFTPAQPICLFQQRFTIAKRQWEIRYHAIPTSDADYAIDVFYNEGDSIRKITFGTTPYHIALQHQLGTLTPTETGYCPGNDLVFSLQLDASWQNILLQTVNQNESQVERCFDWSGSPAPVTFLRREGDKYLFSTQAAGSSTADYHCKLSVKIAYQSAATKPSIDTSFTATYDVPIQKVDFGDAKGFIQHETTICQGEDIKLRDLTDPGATVQEYRDGNNQRITNFNYYIPSKSEEVSAIITAPCAWTDKLKINVIDKSKIQNISSSDTLICAGETVSFSAVANSPITWNIEHDNSDLDESLPDIGSGTVLTRTFSDNATVKAIVSQCGMDFKSFQIKVVQRPQAAMNAETRSCPYTPVNLNGTGGGGNPTYSLYDLRNKTDLTATMGAYLNPTGLTNYPMRPNDSLRLTYTVSNQATAAGFKPSSLTCANSAEAQIIAYPLPPIRISYDGTAYTNGGTVCVPREKNFTLTASGADTYDWLEVSPYARTNRTLELAKDSLIRVRGVENAHRCFDTFALRCVVSVEKAGRIQSAEDCPGVEICFEADELPSTAYAWYGPDGNALTGETKRQLCRTFQAGQAGTYTLKTQRLGCSESLAYTLTLYPAPAISLIVNSPICVGDELVFNYHTGLPMTDVQCALTKDGTPVSGDQLNGDLYRYRKADVQVADGGRYILTVTTDHDCVANDTTDIEVEEPIDFTVSINPAQDFCEGESANVLIEPKGDYTYRLYTDHREIYEGPGNRIPVTWQRLDNGTLHADIQQIVCISQTATDIVVIPTPVISGNIADTGLCQRSSLWLSPVSDIAPQEVIWHWINNDGKHSQMPAQTTLPYYLENVDVSMSGRYFAEAANLVGNKRCASVSDTTRLTVYPTPDLDINGPQFICEGSTVTLTAVSKTAAVSFRWLYNNATDATISVSNAGQYIVTGTSAYGCRDSASITLEARPTPYFSLPPDTSICRGSSFMIYGPDGMDAYHWNDGSQEKDILAEKGGWYILTVYRNECPYSDSLKVTMTFCGQFHFPTAFTPNDNRVNDTWGAISSAKDEDMAEYDLMVFDRNGKKVFHGKRISEQWDGRYKGELCPPGLYMYSFKALEKLDGIKYQSNGTVTIIR